MEITLEKPTQDYQDVDFLYELGRRVAAADPFHDVLERVVEFISSVIKCDSCFVYVLESDELVLRASKNPHSEVVDRLKLRVGQGITGWVAETRRPVVISKNAFKDRRFQAFSELPEDRFEAFLSVPVISHGQLVAVLNLQHRSEHVHTRREVQLVATIGFLVGAEIKMARLEGEVSHLADQLESRKVIERAKGILQREMGLTEEEAYLRLQRESRQRRRSMREVASALILSDEVTKEREQKEPKGA